MNKTKTARCHDEQECGHKICTVCKQMKPLTEFPVYHARNNRIGYRGQCIQCHKSKRRKYYLWNKEDIIQQSTRWYLANKEKKLKRDAEWRNERKSHIKAWRKNYNKTNKEKILDYYKSKRARKRTATIEKFSTSEICERDGWICQLCHKKVNRRLKYPHPQSKTLDHIIPLSKGGEHSRINVHLAHLICNEKVRTGGIKQLRLIA